MRTQTKRELGDVEIYYTTPLAAALHQLCVERFERTLRRVAEVGDSRELVGVAGLSETKREIDADIVSIQRLLDRHGVGRVAGFTKPSMQLVSSPGVPVSYMLATLGRFDRLVVCTSNAYLQGLMGGDVMDAQLDGYVEKIHAHARNLVRSSATKDDSEVTDGH